MGHPLRLFLPGLVYEVTVRTANEQLLLRPGPEVNEIILGILGRALFLYPAVALHAFCYLSDHGHLLISATNAEAMAAWLGYVNGNIAREMNRLLGRSGPFWGRRARVIPVVDDDAVVGRLAYILGQGCKEGLVASPRDWPGASSTPGLLGDMTLEGTWFDRDLATRAHRVGKEPGPRQFTTRYSIKLSPLPSWSHLERSVLTAEHERMVAEIELRTARDNLSRGVSPLGRAAVLRADPNSRPAVPARTPAPCCHASHARTRSAFVAVYRSFCAAFRLASKALRRVAASALAPPAALSQEFPPGSFPPPSRPVPYSGGRANLFTPDIPPLPV